MDASRVGTGRRRGPDASWPGPASDEELAEQAAQWIVRLSDDDEAERERASAGFADWKRADPRHAAAAGTLEKFIGQVQAVRDNAPGGTRPARAALDAAFTRNAARRRARRLGTALSIAFLLAVPAWLALRAWPAPYLMADLRTSTGEWETRTLSDGTRITLNGASAIDLHYDERRRTVELVQGAILVDVAHDAARPFLVETPHGSIRALGTRFAVERHDDATVLDMIQSRVRVQTAAQRAAGGGAATIVTAGQRMRIAADGAGAVEAIDPGAVAHAWRHHQLVVADRPLAEVLDGLARHRPGLIHYDRTQIAHVRVSAVLPLDDTDRALQLLLTGFPELRVRTVTPWLVLVDAPPAPEH